MPRRTIILRLAYNGSNFHGYQRQPNLRTVENIIFKALRNSGCVRTSPPEHYSYSGRTDKGVHALFQTVSFLSDNDCSPKDIAELVREYAEGEVLMWAYRVENELLFNARRWALWREYVYVDEVTRYKCPDLEENLNQAKVVLSQRQHRYAYKDVRRFTDSYLERRILRLSIVLKGSTLIWGIMGESFPHNYIRRLIHIFRTRPCGVPLLQHAYRSHQGLAEPNRLILSSVKYPLSLRIMFDKQELLNNMMKLFRKESSVLHGVIYFYENEKRFSRPF